MKKSFVTPELEIVSVSATDVIATSGETVFYGEEDPFNFNDPA